MVAFLTPNFSPGRVAWELIRDVDGHRDYVLRNRVETTTSEDGPQVVMNAAGLPVIGAPWTFGNDIDLWAFCTPEMRVVPDQTPGAEPHRFWLVEQRFTTRPLSRCQDTLIEDPLLEPDIVSGSFLSYTTHARQDKDGNEILTSSFERLPDSAETEVDENRATVTIEQNAASLELDTFTEQMNTVNDATLWGLGPRKIKLSRVTWERRVYGVCNYYYTRRFDFDIRFDTFDFAPTDIGTKILKGHWDGDSWVLDNIGGVAPDPDKPHHFIRIPDRHGEMFGRLLLDGAGKPNTTGTPVPIPLATDSGGKVKYYPESNFLTLGIPTTL